MPILDMPDGSYVSYRGKPVLDEATKQKLRKLVELARKQAAREALPPAADPPPPTE